MDFGAVLYEAQKNERHAESRPNFYKTKFSPPKKISKDKTKLSLNVQKFLEKQEEEERRKKEDDKKKLSELLTLRNQDRKSVNRVNKMLKLTKSANKSVLDEEEGETMVTPSEKQKKAGSFQPDEDDYGYSSQAASALYDQLSEKYLAMPEPTPRFLKPVKSSAKNISDIKDRVKAALRKEEDEKLLPHKRKRKHKESEGDEEESGRRYRSDEDDDRESDRDREKREREKEREKAKRKPMPPPMDFSELMKLAEKKQHEPVKVEKKDAEKEKKPTRSEPERLMTKKERREYAEHVERRRRLKEKEREAEARENDKGGGKIKIKRTGGEKTKRKRKRSRSKRK
uniref:Protein SPT2 homolog n=1 Tax=Cacopsylla melanoneura TaxID=428564 RepID=A0A8D8M8A1_9HEMI